MKKFAIIVSLFMQFRPFFPVLDYVLNYHYIVTELCENRDNIVMGCDGKCYLVKELAKASDVEKPASQDKKNLSALSSVDSFIVPQNLPQDGYFLNSIDCKTEYSPYQDCYAYLQTHSFFHPPTVIA